MPHGGSDATLIDAAIMAQPPSLQVLNGCLKNFIAAGTDTCNRWLHLDVGLDAKPLQLSSVRMADVDADEVSRNASGRCFASLSFR